jgi:predicted amidohydrolase
MQLLACQIDTAWEDRETNLRAVRAMLQAKRPAPGSLVVLPEMFAVGFSMNVQRVVEAHDGPTVLFLGEIARAYQSWVIGGVPMNGQAGRAQNTAIVASPDGTIIARYAKLHPFALGGEREHYVAGDEVVIVRCGEFNVAPFVCYDLRFPEIFRRAVKRGAQLFAVIANWPQARVEHWTTLLRARAIENQAYVIGVNRCGSDPKLRYSGRSMIIDPSGEVLADSGCEQTLIAADATVERVESYRSQLPFLQDMRDDN